MAETGARKIRLGMVGGGTGAFIGYVHRIASRLDGDYELVAGALSSRPEVAKESGREHRARPRPRLHLLRGDGEEGSRACRRHRSGVDRHPQQRAFRPGQGLPRSRHPRHLRQAADLDARRRAGAGGDQAEERREIPAHPQLYRLSAGAAGARAGEVGRARQDPRHPGRVSAGLAVDAERPRQQAGCMAHRSETLRRRRRHRRYRHTRLQPACASFPG